MRAILTFILSMLAFAGIAQEIDTVETRIYFGCNSSTLTASEQSKVLAIRGQIISVEGYASIEGKEEDNFLLSNRRAEAVASILEVSADSILHGSLAVGRGETAEFGNTLRANRVVVVRSIQIRPTTSLNVLPADSAIITAGNDPEGFNCGNVVDPSNYFHDTVETVAVDTAATVVVREPLVLPTVEPVLLATKGSAAPLELIPAVDTFYLPTAQAVRFYMKRGMSRREAIETVEARKPQWKPLKKEDIRKPKRKRLQRKTMGKNDSFWSHLFPYRGC